MKLTSPDFKNGEPIPQRFTGEGDNVSPALQWEDAPNETQQFALVCEDIDSPGVDLWVHWVLYEIPADTHSLPAAIPTDHNLNSPAGAMQGCNSFSIGNMYGYQGPMPHSHSGLHHYRFVLYSLDKKLDLESRLHLKTIMCAMEGHVLAKAELQGTFER